MVRLAYQTQFLDYILSVLDHIYFNSTHLHTLKGLGLADYHNEVITFINKLTNYSVITHKPDFIFALCIFVTSSSLLIITIQTDVII